MNAEHFADYEIARTSPVTEWFDFYHPAFHFYFAFFNHRWPYHCGRLHGEASFGKFIYTFWKFATCKACLVHHIIIDDVDDDFGDLLYIFEGVFGGIVSYSS